MQCRAKQGNDGSKRVWLLPSTPRDPKESVRSKEDDRKRQRRDWDADSILTATNGRGVGSQGRLGPSRKGLRGCC